MQTFKQLITEARDVRRFLKKNRNLSKEEIETLNTYFTKINPKAGKEFGKEIGWDSEEARNMTYNDFKAMLSRKYRSGFKMFLNIKLPGKKGKDYWPIKLKDKGFVATIPMNQKMAQYLNSCDYGFRDVTYCIGWPDSKSYWNRHVIIEQKVPVYVIDGVGKWVVMILPGNEDYEVWDKFNSHDLAQSKSEPIPNFSIKKNLLTRRLGDLYDEMRDHYKENIDMKDVYNDMDNLADDIHYQIDNGVDEYKEYMKEWDATIDGMEEFYIESLDSMESALKEYKERFDDAWEKFDSLETDFAMAEFEGQLYTKVELSGYIVKLQNAIKVLEERIEEVQEYYDNFTSSDVYEHINAKDYPYHEDDHDRFETQVADYLLDDMDVPFPPDWPILAHYHIDLFSYDGYNSDYQNYLEYVDMQYGNSAIHEMEVEIDDYIRDHIIELDVPNPARIKSDMLEYNI